MTLSPADISRQKAELRREMKSYRAQLGEQERARASQKLCDILSNWLRTRDENRIAIYLALPTEINLDALGAELIERDKIVCAPRLDTATGTMCFARLPDLDAVTRGAYGVREPVASEIVRPQLALVPALAFDQTGGRLGMGGGWYDRALSDISVKVGVGFGAQIVANVPVEAHDIKMDWLASETGLWRVQTR